VKSLLLILGMLLATAGGVITYRALYLEPRSAVIITETDVRHVPNYARVVGGALLFVGGTAMALYAAMRRVKT
jgi:predicted outer membrane lipoprotein